MGIVTRQTANVIVLLTFAVVLIIPLFWSKIVGIGPAKAPGDILIPYWSLSRSAALDIKSRLYIPSIIQRFQMLVRPQVPQLQ